MELKEREMRAPSRWRALIASVVIGVGVVTSSGVLDRLSGPALAAPALPVCQTIKDTSGGRNIFCKSQNIPPVFKKPVTITVPKVAGVPPFKIVLAPPTTKAEKTNPLPANAVVKVTENKTTGQITVTVTVTKNGKTTTIPSWTTPVEFTVPKYKNNTEVYVLQMLTNNPTHPWVTLPTKNGQVAITKGGVYRWVLVKVPTPTKKKP